jgi:hypothetical protein
MTCSEFESRMADLDEDLLGPDEATRLGSHLAGCPACQRALAETRALVGRLEDAGRVATGKSLVDPVVERIEARRASRARTRTIAGRLTRAVAATIIVGAGVASLTFGPARPGLAVAADLKAAKAGMEKAMSATWKVSYYQKLHTKDGRSSRWFRDSHNLQRYYYKAPGLYRRENLDPDGKVNFVSIEDGPSRARIEINHKERSAVLTPLGLGYESDYRREGPFASFLEAMASPDLVILPERQIDGARAVGFRYEYPASSPIQPWDFDFWLDARTKILVRAQVPGADIFDDSNLSQETAVPFPIPFEQPVKDGGKEYFVDRERRAEQQNSGHAFHDIVFNPDLGDDLFSLEPPEGYTLKRAEPPRIVEADVIDFLRVVVDFFDGTFPDSFPHFNRDPEVAVRYNKAERAVLDKKDPTPAETAFIEANRRWLSTGIPGPGPAHVFIHELITPGTWKYLGKGAKLGEKDRIIGWYRPKDAANYRVIHGDLSVKETAAADLPLPVGP